MTQLDKASPNGEFGMNTSMVDETTDLNGSLDDSSNYYNNPNLQHQVMMRHETNAYSVSKKHTSKSLQGGSNQ